MPLFSECLKNDEDPALRISFLHVNASVYGPGNVFFLSYIFRKSSSILIKSVFLVRSLKMP